ncbi:hypothetical protein lbkm_2116 [Lachnospiraceae bacterium KM106-2]|nr:hypothetical protein lbkm_2116 [Lachnospiraceae bacterium KM106-2]
MGNKKYDQIVAYIVEEQDKFYRLAYSYTNSREDSLDVVQNAIIKAIENYRSLYNIDAI